MNLYTPAECAANHAAAGRDKMRAPAMRMLLLAVLAESFIAMGGAVTNTAAPPSWKKKGKEFKNLYSQPLHAA